MNTTVLQEKTKSKFVCEFCEKAFAREESIAVHVCEPKRRHQERGEKGVQLGLQAYLKFYEYSQGSARLKTWEDFASSPYYRAFVKFGRYCQSSYVINPVRFMEWLLKNNKKIDYWCQDFNYNQYLIEYLQLEAVADALCRSIEYSIAWAEKNTAAPHDCLRYGNRNVLCHAVTTGRISPWTIYNCVSGQEFLNELNNEQIAIVWPYIDTDRWQKRFSDYSADQLYAQQILKQAGW